MNATFSAQQSERSHAQPRSAMWTVVGTADIKAAPSDEAQVLFRAQRGDRVSVIGFDRGFGIVDLGNTVGYLRQEIISGSYGPSANSPMGGATRHQGATSAHTSNQPGRGEREHTGANRVATGLSIVAWIVLAGGNLLAALAASSYDCRQTFGSSCSGEGATQIGIFALISVLSTLCALFTWATAYTVLLLASMNNKLGAQERRSS